MGRTLRTERGVLIVLLILALSFLTTSLQLKHSFADSVGWLSSGQPTLHKDYDLPQSWSVPTEESGNCKFKTVTTRPAIAPFQAEQSYYGCFVETATGLSANNYLLVNNTKVAGKVLNANGSPSIYVSIPNSPHVIHLSSGTGNGGSAFRLTKNALSKMTVHVSQTQEVTYTFTQPPDITLRDGAGNLLSARTDTISFSEDGSWFTVDVPGKAIMRVNIETFEAIPFAPSFNYNIGVDPGVKGAISNDGRYALVSSGNFSTLKIYDMSTCSSVPATITGPVSCQSFNLQQFMQTQGQGFVGTSVQKFITNDVIQFYGTFTQNNVRVTSRYRLVAPGKQLVSMQYLALGDSYISGEGTYLYKAGTDISPNKCHLSQASYPYLIKDQLGLETAESVACSGAVMEDVTTLLPSYTGQTEDKAMEDRDEEEKNQIKNKYLPGYIAQHEFVNEYKPSIITISTVGNDIGFGDKIKRCLEPDTCYSSYEDRLEIVRDVSNKFDKLVNMYNMLKSKAAVDAKVYAINYPKIVANGNCASNVHLNDQEITFANQLVDHLNEVIRQAAARAGVVYVDASEAFAGNRLCETESSNTAANGLVTGDDAPIEGFGPIGKESYHPNIKGHELLKTAVLNQTQNFTVTNPSANPLSMPTSESDTMPILANAPKTGRPIYTVNYDDDLANEVVVRGGTWGLVMKGAEFGVKVLSEVKAWMFSEPTELGTYTLDANGDLATTINIPATISPGFHTLSLRGQNVLGEPIEIQKVVYVAASESDYDGDGIPNSEEKCLAVEAVNNDQDIDGIDDACDPFIDEAPTPPTVEFLAPATDQTQSGTITVQIRAEDEKGVENVIYQVDGVEVGEPDTEAPYEFELDTKTLSKGLHTISAIAYNTIGLHTSKTIEINVYNLPPPPSVQILSPANGATIYGTVQISADAQDEEGVAGVQFAINGANIGPELARGPYAYNWDTKTATNGAHTISATARSVNGQESTKSITVNVQNQTTQLSWWQKLLKVLYALLNYFK